MLKSFRYLLFPFSLLYGAAILLRNFLFDKKIFKSASFNFPIVCVGNLAAGGTGKTPMTEYLIELLQNDFEIATLSRGYKRKTKGYAIANEKSTALEIGDEPMQFHEKYKNITVAVGEERIVAIPQILHDKPNTDVIILDDGFQHRTVVAGLNIILTDFKNLYTRDIMLPSGDLRDIKSSSKRADIIVVTKCKSNLTKVESANIVAEIKPISNQKVFFSEILYAEPYHLFTQMPASIEESNDVLLIVGIANPKPLKTFLEKHTKSYEMLRFADHHIFSSTDLREILKHYKEIKSENKIIITTEKDAVRLRKFEKELKHLPIFVIPIKLHFLFNESIAFNKTVFDFINSYKKTV